MTVTPSQIVIRFNRDGTAKGASVQHLEIIDGRASLRDPVPLAVAGDEMADYATQFAADAVVERDVLRERAERAERRCDELEALAESQAERIKELESPPNPRMIDPVEWQRRFDPGETTAIALLDDAGAKQFVVSLNDAIQARAADSSFQIDLDSQAVVQGVHYLTSLGVLGPGRASQLLQDSTKTEQ